MIDLILRAPDKAAMIQWAKDHGLYEQYIETPAVLDENGDEVTPAVLKWRTKKGLEYSWWGGRGKFLTSLGTYDENGDVITPPTYASGVVLLLRIHSQFFRDDVLVPNAADPDKEEQWARSKVVRYIKNNGVAGNTGAINYWELDGVQAYRPADVQAYLTTNGLPGHRYL